MTLGVTANPNNNSNNIANKQRFTALYLTVVLVQSFQWSDVSNRQTAGMQAWLYSCQKTMNLSSFDITNKLEIRLYDCGSQESINDFLISGMVVNSPSHGER